MSGNLARLPAIDDEATTTEDRRREPRHAARVGAWLRSSQAERAPARILDVSNHGCAVEAEARWLRAGSFVSVGIGENPPLGGIVRWVRNGAAGLEFLGVIPAGREEWHNLMECGSFT